LDLYSSYNSSHCFGRFSSDNWSKISRNQKNKRFGQKTLHLLEKFLDLTKTAFKRTEQIVSRWTEKLRAWRKEKKSEDVSLTEIPSKPDEAEFLEEIEKTELISADLSKKEEKVAYAGREVVVRKKIMSEPVVISKPEPLPEDKVREAALIYRIAENPKDIEAYREIGDYYMSIGNIKDAKEAFKMVLKLRPRDLKAKSSLREIEMRLRLGS
jgi:tetratricopeptide (TPR) repeat protein